MKNQSLLIIPGVFYYNAHKDYRGGPDHRSFTVGAVGQLLQDVTTVTTVTGLHTCLNTVSTPVFLSQHLVSQHLFWRLNTCHLRQICVSTLIRKPCVQCVTAHTCIRLPSRLASTKACWIWRDLCKMENQLQHGLFGS